MHGKTKYTIHSQHHHHGWDRDNAPVLTVAPGESIVFETVDSSGQQLSPRSTVSDISSPDFSKVNPVTGPVVVDGARPSDALRVTIDGFRPSSWGWTAIIPGCGLLADQFTEPALALWKYDADQLARLIHEGTFASALERG